MSQVLETPLSLHQKHIIAVQLHVYMYCSQVINRDNEIDANQDKTLTVMMVAMIVMIMIVMMLQCDYFNQGH